MDTKMARTFVFTSSWDDGFPSDLRVADLLCRYDLEGTFFTPISNASGRPVLGSFEIAALAKGFEIGGHTLNHVYLRQHLRRDEIASEILRGKATLEDWIGEHVDGFCYPGGVYDSRVIEEVRAAGFKYGRTVENLVLDLGSNKWLVPTTVQFFPHPPSVYLRNFVRYPGIEKITLCGRSLITGGGMQFFFWLLNQVALKGGVFHLWGHSWELDRYDLWGALEAFLKEVKAMSPTSCQLRHLLTPKTEI